MDENITALLSYLKVKRVQVIPNGRTELKLTTNQPISSEVLTVLKQNKSNVLTVLKNNLNVVEYPASSLQNAVWRFLNEKGESTNIHFGFIFNGRLDEQRLNEALLSIIKRHEILQSTFTLRDETLYIKTKQVNSLLYAFELLEAENLTESKRLCEKLRDIRFDLFEDQLIKAYYITVKNQSIVFFVISHMIFDGFSIHVFIKDFIDCFYFGGKLLCNNELSFQFRDYVGYSSFSKTLKIFNNAKVYWENLFADDYEVKKLSAERSRVVMSRISQTISTQLVINNKTYSFIQEYCKNNEFILSDLFFGIELMIIKKLSGMSKILIESSYHNRDLDDLSDQIGLYTNSIFVLPNLENCDSLESVIKEGKRAHADAIANNCFNSNMVFDEILLKKGYDHQHVRKFKFNYINQGTLSFTDQLNWSNLNLRPRKLGCYFSLFTFVASKNSIQISIELNRTFFPKKALNTIVGLFNGIITSIPSNNNILL